MSNTPIAAGYKDWEWRTDVSDVLGTSYLLAAKSMQHPLVIICDDGRVVFQHWTYSHEGVAALSRIVLAKLAELEAPHE